MSILLGILTMGLIIPFGIPDAHAVSNTLNESFCGTMTGMWDIDTCTITSEYTILSSDELIIPNGTSLVISNNLSNGIENKGTIMNNGEILISNNTGIGLTNFGFITNNGDLTISSGGFLESWEFTNNGSITITNNGYIALTGQINNFGTILISNNVGYGLSHVGTVVNKFGGLITISNTGGNGIDSAGPLENNSGGIITISNKEGSENGIKNSFGFIGNKFGGLITISNTGGIGIFNTGSIVNSGIIANNGSMMNNGIFINDGTIFNKLGGQITNSGLTLTNSGQIINQCGGGYSGILPIGNSVIDDCITCIPTIPNWTVTNSCRLESNTIIRGNVLVQNNSTLVILDEITLDIDFANFNLTIGSGSKI